jgi:hypothetical protein
MSLLLRYAPPPQVSPTYLYAGVNGSTFGSSGSPYSSTQDLIIVLPSQPVTGQIRFYGGRHVRMIGGSFLPSSSIGNYVVVGQQVSGSFFAEGLEFPDQSGGQGVNSSIAPDIIDVCGDWSSSQQGFAPDIYIQNCRCLNITASNSTNHADFLQPQGLINNLYVDMLTVSTNYDVFTIATDSCNNIPPKGAFFSRINTWWYAQNSVNPYTAHYWLNSVSGSVNNDTAPFPISFYKVYADSTRAAGTGGGRTQYPDEALYPNYGVTAGGGVLLNGSSGSPFTNGEAIGASRSPGATHGSGYAYYADPKMKVTGAVYDASPLTTNSDVIVDSDGLGSYVPAGIGTNYISPGYMSGGVLQPMPSARVH